MMTADQLRNFVHTLIELQSDSFLELLRNEEFQKNNQEKKELAVKYISTLFKKEMDDRILKMELSLGM